MNDVEGPDDGNTPLDPDERDGLKFAHVTTREELNQLEQANVASGLAWLSSRRQTDVLSEQFLRELHRRLFGDVWTWAGSFLQTEKNIGIDPLQIAVQLRLSLDDARYWSENRTFPALEAAARFHHRLAYIHPFPNGNGRHARIAADAYIKVHFDHEPIDWAAGHNLQSKNSRRADYIVALRAADAGDIAPLLAFVSG